MAQIPATPAPHQPRFLTKRVGRYLTLSVCLAWLLGQVYRDTFYLTGLCFYIPSPALACICLVRAGLDGWQRRRNGLCFALFAVPPVAMTILVENAPQKAPNTAELGLRIVHWNVGGRLVHDRQGAVLQAHLADLYVLSEIPHGVAVEEFRAALGEAYQAQTFANLAVVGRGELRALGWLINIGRFKVQKVEWRHADTTWQLLVVDCPSNILIHRDPLLRELNVLMEEHEPDLVIGDCNAPRRSRAFTAMPDGYHHAYDTVGTGLGYAWPTPVPMYAIDHIIYGPKVTPLRYELISSWASDHRVQVFDWHQTKK